MPEPLQEELNKIPDLITQKIDEAKQHIKINKTVFWLILAGVIIGCGIALYFIMHAQTILDARIKKDDLIMRQMADSVKLRDAHIVRIVEDMKKKDAIIAASRDSVNKALVIISKLQIAKNANIKKHKTDSIAINHLNLDGKIRFITGRNTN